MVVGVGGASEEAALDDAWLVVSELTTALLSGPEFAAYSLPAIPSGTGETIVLSSAVARAGGAAGGSVVVVGVVEVSHWVFADWRGTGRRQWIAHARWAASATRVIGQCITTTCIARSHASGRWWAGRGRLRVESRVGEGAGLHEARGERRGC